jgi:hypothetical protein
MVFKIWLFGPEKFDDLLDYLNSMHSNVQFTMETQIDGPITFLVTDK